MFFHIVKVQLNEGKNDLIYEVISLATPPRQCPQVRFAGLTPTQIPNKTHLPGLPSRRRFPHLRYKSEEKWCLNE